ncbi:MAG: hypothetical protein R8P61_21380 [Bacteroidia bacterium]|nr:hypothetical protein [Bacteroidia bacterium]
MRKIFIAISLLLSILFILALRPVPMLKENECKEVIGTLERLQEGPGYDLVFKLAEDSRHFYINRALEQGLNLAELKAQLIGKEISLKYPEHWTPLDPFNESIHVSILEFEGKKLYDETPQE